MRDGGRVRGEGGWLRVAFAAMENPLHAREVEMPRGKQPSISSTASPSYPLTSPFPFLLVFLVFSFLYLSCFSSSTSTFITFQAKKGHLSSKWGSPSLSPSKPSSGCEGVVDVSAGAHGNRTSL